jgi:hypothetical protein
MMVVGRGREEEELVLRGFSREVTAWCVAELPG